MLHEIKQILTAKEKRQAVIITGFDLLMAILDIGFLAVLMLLVSRYTEPSRKVALTGIGGRLSQMPAILFLFLFLLKNAAAYVSGAKTNRFFAAVSTRLSMEQLKTFFYGDSANFNHTDASVFVRRISQQPVEFSTYILANLQTVVSQTLLAVCAIIAIVLYHPALFVVLFALLLPPLLGIGWLLRKRLRLVRQETKRIAEKAIQYLQESLGAYVEANIYRKSGFFVRRFVLQQGQMNDNIARQQTLQTLPSRLLETVAVAGFFLLVGLRNWLGGDQETDWLTIGIFLGAAWKIIPALVRILNSSGQIKTYSFILPDLVNGSAARNAAGDDFAASRDSSRPAIRSVSVQQLQYCHAPGKPELKISFHLNKGDLVALSGRSGSGKTTLLQLMAGFLHPGKGAVKINLSGAEPGAGPAEVKGIAYVKQQPFLLNDTLRKNISLSDADNDQEKTARIAYSVGLGPLLSANRLGLEQPVTENGRNISGGQRQRIMLARALYTDPQLLLLDEPFSELDAPAEQEMMQLLQLLAASGMIIFIATHNAAAARLCHSVISLDEAVYA